MKGGHVRIRRRLTGGLLILVLLALMLRPGPQALAQTVSPAPAPTGAGAQVQDWADGPGLDLARQAVGPDASVSLPIEVETWSTGVLSATDLDDPTEPTATWAAVISCGQTPVGVLVIDVGDTTDVGSGGEPQPSGTVQDDAVLAGALAALPEQAVVLRESVVASATGGATPLVSSAPSRAQAGTSTPGPSGAASADYSDPVLSDAWYALDDGLVTALDEQAASGLAGPVDLSSYAQVLRERAHGSSDIDGSESRKSPRKPDLGILYTGLGVLVIGTLVVTITFVHERRVLAPLREAPSSTRTEDPEPAP